MKRQLVPVLFGGFNLAAFIRSQSDGFFIDSSKIGPLFQDSSGTTPVASIGDVIGRENDLSGKGHNATQSTSTFRPTFQTTGTKFDGADDNLLTNYVAGSGANFIVALVTVPASLAAAQIIAGLANASFLNRFYLCVNTDGTVGAGIGSQNSTVVKGTTDYRGQTVVLGVSIDGSTVRLFAATVREYQAAQSGVVDTSSAMALGAENAGGSLANFFAGSIKRIVAGRQFLDLATYLKIRNALLAS